MIKEKCGAIINQFLKSIQLTLILITNYTHFCYHINKYITILLKNYKYNSLLSLMLDKYLQRGIYMTDKLLLQ